MNELDRSGVVRVPVHMCGTVLVPDSTRDAKQRGEASASSLNCFQSDQAELNLPTMKRIKCPFCEAWMPPGSGFRDHCDSRPARPGVAVLEALRLQGEDYGNDLG